LAPVHVEHLIAFLGQRPQPLLRARLKQLYQGSALLVGIALRDLERTRFDDFLETGVKRQSGNDSGLKGQSHEPERRLSKAENANRRGAGHGAGVAAETRQINAKKKGGFEIAPHLRDAVPAVQSLPSPPPPVPSTWLDWSPQLANRPPLESRGR